MQSRGYNGQLNIQVKLGRQILVQTPSTNKNLSFW